MQTCPECGGRNEDGELFCGQCGGYLEWEEPRAAAAGPPTAAESHDRAAAAGAGAAEQHTSTMVSDPDDEAAERSPEAPPAGQEAEVCESGTEPPAVSDAPQEHPEVPPAQADTVEAPHAAQRSRGPATLGAGAVGGATGGGATGGGALGRRASRMLRQSADRATGGAVTRTTGTASRARSQAGRVTRTPAAGAPATSPAPSAPHEADTLEPRKPAPRKPAARKPGAPAPRRPVPASAEEEPPPKPGELICGACGVGNARHRNFCRRCGANLADAPAAPQRSWWRRLVRPDPRSGPSAGTRPRGHRRRFPTRLVVLLVVLGLVAGAGWYFRSQLGEFYGIVADRVVGRDPVTPTAPTASSEYGEQAAALAVDNYNNTYWAPEPVGDGAIDEWIDIPFSEPFRLARVGITTGVSPDPGERIEYGRPRSVRLTMSTPAGLVVRQIQLRDVPEAHVERIGLDDVSAVRLTILSTYGADLEAPVAVAEVAFQGR